MRYQIEHFTLCDGWVSSLFIDGVPETFASYDEALKELNDYFSELQEDVANGSIEAYSRNDFRIMEITE